MSNRLAAGIVLGVVVLACVAGIGVTAYDVGVTQGLAQGAQTTAQPSGMPLMLAYRPHFWGFGFLVPILYFVAIFGLVRLFIGGRHRGWYGPYSPQEGVPSNFEQWHRKLHSTPTEE